MEKTIGKVPSPRSWTKWSIRSTSSVSAKTISSTVFSLEWTLQKKEMGPWSSLLFSFSTSLPEKMDGLIDGGLGRFHNDLRGCGMGMDSLGQVMDGPF